MSWISIENKEKGIEKEKRFKKKINTKFQRNWNCHQLGKLTKM